MSGYKHLAKLAKIEAALSTAMVTLAGVDDDFTNGEARLEETDTLIDAIENKIDSVVKGVRGVRRHSHAKVVQGSLFGDGRSAKEKTKEKTNTSKGGVEKDAAAAKKKAAKKSKKKAAKKTRQRRDGSNVTPIAV